MSIPHSRSACVLFRCFAVSSLLPPSVRLAPPSTLFDSSATNNEEEENHEEGEEEEKKKEEESRGQMEGAKTNQQDDGITHGPPPLR